MGKIIFILGGVRSGKSSFAFKEADLCEGRKAFIATAEALDKDMGERIARHKQERDDRWETFEEPIDVRGILDNLQDRYDVVLIDCLTLWVSNLIIADRDMEAEFDALVSALISSHIPQIYIVSNEVGMGIVPEHPLGRVYRDQLGLLNKNIAGVASHVILMVAGISLEIKGKR